MSTDALKQACNMVSLLMFKRSTISLFTPQDCGVTVRLTMPQLQKAVLGRLALKLSVTSALSNVISVFRL